jgi:hypothetical protein
MPKFWHLVLGHRVPSPPSSRQQPDSKNDDSSSDSQANTESAQDRTRPVPTIPSQSPLDGGRVAPPPQLNVNNADATPCGSPKQEAHELTSSDAAHSQPVDKIEHGRREGTPYTTSVETIRPKAKIYEAASAGIAVLKKIMNKLKTMLPDPNAQGFDPGWDVVKKVKPVSSRQSVARREGAGGRQMVKRVAISRMKPNHSAPFPGKAKKPGVPCLAWVAQKIPIFKTPELKMSEDGRVWLSAADLDLEITYYDPGSENPHVQRPHFEVWDLDEQCVYLIPVHHILID